MADNKRLKEVVKELKGASKMHLKQSKDIAKHVKMMENAPPFKMKSPYKKISGPCKAAAKRRKSFCARSRSWTSERGRAARRRWNC